MILRRVRRKSDGQRRFKSHSLGLQNDGILDPAGLSRMLPGNEKGKRAEGKIVVARFRLIL
jgi:hypothetical protein